MVDFTYLAKNYRNDSDSSAARRASAWWPTEKDPTGDPDSLNRDFLMGYLLHYCRLCQKLKKRGTGTVLQALLEVEPDNGELHFLLAQQHELENNLHESLACYERAASLRLDKPSYMLEAVRVACMLGERNRGMAMVGSVISAYPIMAEAYYERGMIYETDENWGRALRDYEMCARLDPKNPAYLCAIASMYRRQKMYKMARRCAAKALKLDPNYGPAHEELRQLPLFEQFVDFFRSEDAEQSKKNDGDSYSRKNLEFHEVAY